MKDAPWKSAAACSAAGLILAAALGIQARGLLQVASSTADQPSGLEMEFVKIQPGEFMMGCSPNDKLCYPAEKPTHRVRITKSFEIGKFEVTQAQWQSLMATNPSHFKGNNLPVEQVSWEDAQQFLSKLNQRNDGYRYRLPTEAEWEYAARAGTTEANPGLLDSIAWYAENSEDTTHPVGQKEANDWGLYDVIGNVSEWVQDWYGEYKSGPATDPTGPPKGQYRVLRGGSWNLVAAFMRVSDRSSNDPSQRYVGYGFRCVRDGSP